MKVDVTGTRNGDPWPARGEEIDLPDDEAKDLCAAGIAMSYAAAQVIQSSGAQTPPGNSAGFSVPPGSTLGVVVSVTAVGTTITFTMQWSADGTNFGAADPADTFTAITANGVVAKSFTVKAPFARLAWAGTGATTFSASIYVAGA